MWVKYNSNPAGRSVGDCAVRAVAKALDISHIHIASNRSYNNKDVLQSAIYLAYIYALNKYTVIREATAGKGFAVIAAEVKELSDNTASAAASIARVCDKMNDNVKNIKQCLDDIILFIKNDITGIFKDMHSISDKLADSINAANDDIDAMTTILGRIRGETGRLDTIVGKNEEGVLDINSKAHTTASKTPIISTPTPPYIKCYRIYA